MNSHDHAHDTHGHCGVYSALSANCESWLCAYPCAMFDVVMCVSVCESGDNSTRTPISFRGHLYLGAAVTHRRPLPAVRSGERQHYPRQRYPPGAQRPDPPTARASPRGTPPHPLRRRRHRRHRQRSRRRRRRHWRGPARRHPCPWRRGSHRAARFASARAAPPVYRALARGARRSARQPPGEEEEEAPGEGGGPEATASKGL